MEEIKLSDINLLDVGNGIHIAGVIWSSSDISFITTLPSKKEDFPNLKLLPMDLDEWERFLRQTDLCETEILTRDPKTDFVTKSIYRKTQRQIDQYVTWAVFQRDNYTCRYCGKTGIPLTVDHIILWELGGPTLEANLLTACRNCNGKRHSKPYDEWLQHPVYLEKSRNLPESVRRANAEIVAKLPELEKLKFMHQRKR